MFPYLVVTFLVLSYLVALYLLNRHPSISVKSIGWCSLRKITFETNTVHLSINKIQLNLNLFYFKKRGFLNLDIRNVNVTFKEQFDVEEHVRVDTDFLQSDTAASSSTREEKIDISRFLTLKISQSIYHFLLNYKILNYFNLKVANLVISHPVLRNNIAEFDYIDCLTKYDGSNSFSFFYLNFYGGFLVNTQKNDRLKVFNNVELEIRCLSYCFSQPTERSKVSVLFKDFVFNLTLGKMIIPLDELNLNHHSQKKKSAKLPSSVKVDTHDLISQVLSTLTAIDIKLENFLVVKDDFSLNFANFSINLQDIKSIALHDLQLQRDTTEINNSQSIHHTNLHKLSIYLTSFNLRHKKDNLFNLANANVSFSSNLIKVSESFHNNTNTTTPQKSNPPKSQTSDQRRIFDVFNVVSGISITTPTIDIYYDQIHWLVQRMNKHKQQKHSYDHHDKFADLSRANETTRFNFRQILMNLDNIVTKHSVIDFKLRVHLPSDPEIVAANFDRRHPENYIFTIDLLSLTNPTTLKVHKKVKKHLKSAFKFKTIKFSFNGNNISLNKFNLLGNYNIVDNQLSVNSLIKNVDAAIANENFFHMVHRITALFKFQKPFQDAVAPFNKPELSHPTCVKLMSAFPSILYSVKFIITSVQISICCEGSFPTYFVEDLDGSKINLADFRRGVKFKMSDLGFLFNRHKEVVRLKINSIQAWSISELGKGIAELKNETVNEFSEFQSDVIDIEHDNFSEMSSLLSDISEEIDDNFVTKPIIYIHDLLLDNADDDKDKLVLRLPMVEGEFDIFLVWIGFYIHALIADTAGSDPNISKKENSLSTNKKYLKFDVDIKLIDFKILLPQQTNILLEVDGLYIFDALTSLNLTFNFLRIYVVHPWTNLWTRLIVIRKTKLSFDSHPSSDANGVKVQLTTDGIRLSTPYQFLFYTVIDNIATLYKSIKQLKSNFRELGRTSNYQRLFPIEEGPKHLPKINIKSRILCVLLEDDPFESELSLIYRLGLIEQRERMRKWATFEDVSEKKLKAAKVNFQNSGNNSSEELSGDLNYTGSILNKTRSTKRAVTSPIALEFDKKVKKVFHRPHQSLTSISSNNLINPLESIKEVLHPNHVEAEIKKAKEKLLSNYSTSWIMKFRAYKQKRIDAINFKADNYWGKESFNPLFTEKHDVLSYPKAISLFTILFNGLDLTIDKPSFDLNKIDEFLFEYGKKQPKITYTTLIPFNVDLYTNSLDFFLRDYPIPLMSFPENHQGNVPAVRLSGDIVINEKLNHREDAMRYIYVPFVPAAARFKTQDNFYSVSIPRTLTPIKLMFNLTFDINSTEACTLSWCKSFQPALSATMAAFDYFTKPPVDTSPKMGFWDKISLLMHGKIRFNIENELRFYIKSSSNPYDLVGDASGMVFCWKNNVSLKINETGKHDEFIILDSQDFVLAIPSFSNIQKEFWNDKLDFKAPSSLDSDKPFQKILMKLSSNENVKWKLGLLFERSLDDTKDLAQDQQSRTYSFKPHYDVALVNPLYVSDKHHDSYKGFRSDYLHLAISVNSTSTGNSSYNTLHTTPGAFRCFFHWWDTFSKVVSLPIKQGKLFQNQILDNRPSIKFGSHLFTVKYQLILEPLYLSHMYMHSSNDDIRRSNKVAFTGLKAKVSRFTMDLHQRKELLHYVNRKLDKKYKVFSLKMNQGEVDFRDADIRLVNALFNVKSIVGYLASKLETSESTSPESESIVPSSSDSVPNGFFKIMEGFDIPDKDYSWLDEDDYSEVDSDDLIGGYPKIKVLPLAFSPRFSYFREFHFNNSTTEHPFGNEPSHHCLIGKNHPEKTQENLVIARTEKLNDQIKANDFRLLSMREKGNMNNPEVKEKHRKLELETKDLKHRLHILHCVLDDLLTNGEAKYDSSSDDDLMSEASDSFMSIHNSVKGGHPLSTYNSRQSFLEMKNASRPDSDSEFHNRFIIHNMQLKWNNELRNLFFQYINKIGDVKSQSYFMTRRAVTYVEDLVNKALDGDDERRNSLGDNDFEYHFKSNSDIIDNFDAELSKVNSDAHEVENSYLFKLVSPQIQLVSDNDTSSCVLVTSRDIESKVLTVSASNLGSSSPADKIASLIETRYGVVFRDAHFFVFKRDPSANKESSVYGKTFSCSTDNHWPPWLDVEMCYDSAPLSDQTIVEKTSIGYIYTKPNKLFCKERREAEKNIASTQEASVFFPKFVIKCSSEQYASVYEIAMDLLMYSDSTRKKSLNRLEKIVSASDWNDFKGIDTRIKNIQEGIRLLTSIKLHLKMRDVILNDQEKDDLINLEIEVERMKIELFVLMKGLQKRGSIKNADNLDTIAWTISSDQIIWHMLTDDKKPFVDLALANSYFTRIEAPGGSNWNKVIVSMIQGFNLQEKPVYPELLTPLLSLVPKPREEMPIIAVEWQMLEPVGGISIMERFESNIQPLKLQLDHHTAKILQEYLFPHDEKLDQTANGTDGFNKEGSDHESTYSSDSVSGVGSNLTSSHSSVTSFLLNQRGVGPTAKTETELKKKSVIPLKKKKKVNERLDNISEMVTRSSNYVSIVEIKVHSMELCVSYKAPKHLNIINVQDLIIRVPTLQYKNKLWSTHDFTSRLKKDIVKIVIHHSGDIIGNKFKLHKRKMITQPLKQISNYVSFTSVQELEELSRSESGTVVNSSTTVRGHKHHHINHNQKLDSMVQEARIEEKDEDSGHEFDVAQYNPRNEEYEGVSFRNNSLLEAGSHDLHDSRS